MMKHDNGKNKQIDAEVRRTLESVDGWADIEPSPNFYAFLQQRLTRSEASSESWLIRLLLGYRLAPSLLALFLILNVLTAWFVLRPGNEARAEYHQAGIEAIAGEFSISESLSFSESGLK